MTLEMTPEQIEDLVRRLARGEIVAGAALSEMVAAMQSGRFALYLARALLRLGMVVEAEDVLTAAIQETESPR